MPVNFPPEGEPLGQDLLPGNSLEQIDAMTELLLDYERIMAEKTSVRAMAGELERRETQGTLEERP